MSQDPKHPTTNLIHHAYVPPEGFQAPQPGVFKASTVIFPSVQAMRARQWKNQEGYTYGLHGTPTTFTLQQRLCTLEGAQHAVLTPSGLSAIALVNMALLKTGDAVLIPDNVYAPSLALAQGELKAWGIQHACYDPLDPEDLRAKLTPNTRLVWLEAAGSVSMEFPPLQALIAICKAHGTKVAIDHTWGAGLAFQPFALGADIAVHALTKYPSGGGDILMGSVTTQDEALHHQIQSTHMRLGLGVGANDVEAVLRGLPSLALRYQAHDVAARQLAQWLQGRPEIAQVLHPALAGSPGHDNWRSVCQQAAGLFSIVFDSRYDSATIDGFCERLHLFKLGYSWGGPVSLAIPCDMKLLRGARWGGKGCLVRLAIGLEAAADLQADLEQALNALP